MHIGNYDWSLIGFAKFQVSMLVWSIYIIFWMVMCIQMGSKYTVYGQDINVPY